MSSFFWWGTTIIPIFYPTHRHRHRPLPLRPSLAYNIYSAFPPSFSGRIEPGSVIVPQWSLLKNTSKMDAEVDDTGQDNSTVSSIVDYVKSLIPGYSLEEDDTECQEKVT